jgi:uncharacterized protein YutE (UPF0331/DUF86 family)
MIYGRIYICKKHKKQFMCIKYYAQYRTERYCDMCSMPRTTEGLCVKYYDDRFKKTEGNCIVCRNEVT